MQCTDIIYVLLFFTFERLWFQTKHLNDNVFSAKVVPTINNTCSVNAKVGDQISCQLKIDDGLDIEVLNNVNKTTTYNRTSKTLYFRQKDDRPHNIWYK